MPNLARIQRQERRTSPDRQPNWSNSVASDRNLNWTSFVLTAVEFSSVFFWALPRIDPEAFLVFLRGSLWSMHTDFTRNARFSMNSLGMNEPLPTVELLYLVGSDQNLD